jgi:type IX secretion system PorP/SprF family membrane protein
MKKILVLLLLFVSVYSIAQQDAQYSNYNMNNFMINPAVAGSKVYLNAKVGMRHQWIGIKGSPKTQFASFHTPINHPTVLPKFRLRKIHHGAGLSLFSDEAGAFKHQSLLGSYALHMKINKSYTLSIGTSAGIKVFMIDNQGLNPQQSTNDALISIGNLRKNLPDVNLGAWLYSDRFYAGITGRQLFANDVPFNIPSLSAQNLERHFFGTIGYKSEINKAWSFVPSSMVQIMPSAPVQVAFNNTFWYDGKFALGLTYRHLDAVYLILDFVVFEALEIGYAFDMTFSGLSKYNTGTHEIILGYRWKNERKKYSCPSPIW